MDARNLEGNLSHRLAFFHKGEGGVRVVVEGDIGSAVFAVGAASVGDDPAGQALGDFLVVRNIAVDDEDAVLGKLLGEETEGVTGASGKEDVAIMKELGLPAYLFP